MPGRASPGGAKRERSRAGSHIPETIDEPDPRRRCARAEQAELSFIRRRQAACADDGGADARRRISPRAASIDAAPCAPRWKAPSARATRKAPGAGRTPMRRSRRRRCLFLRRYGPAMCARADNDPARVLAMLSKIGALLPTRDAALGRKPCAAAILDAAGIRLCGEPRGGDRAGRRRAGALGRHGHAGDLRRARGREAHPQRMGARRAPTSEAAVSRRRRSVASTARRSTTGSTRVLSRASC